MASDAVKHDYHLVKPSPWPLVGSMSATILALGLVVGLKGMLGLQKGNWWVLVAGFIGVFYTILYQLFLALFNSSAMLVNVWLAGRCVCVGGCLAVCLILL